MVLWNGNHINSLGRGLPSFAWKSACRSKEKEGLAIINLKTHNTALLLKFLYKLYNKTDLPWVQLIWKCLYKNGRPPHLRSHVGSFWWNEILKLSTNYMMIATCNIQKGDIIAFWEDLWGLGIIEWKFPQLCSCARKKNAWSKLFSQRKCI